MATVLVIDKAKVDAWKLVLAISMVDPTITLVYRLVTLCLALSR